MKAKEWISDLRVYEPGKPIEEVARELGFDDIAEIVRRGKAFDGVYAAIQRFGHGCQGFGEFADLIGAVFKGRNGLAPGAAAPDMIGRCGQTPNGRGYKSGKIERRKQQRAKGD